MDKRLLRSFGRDLMEIREKLRALDKSVDALVGRFCDSLRPYEEYLKTEKWKLFRNRAISKAGFKCRICSSEVALNVHHRTYENIGDESENDCIVLCEQCHSLFHEHGRLK